jgi:outer membrane protein assembly factor BamA
MRPARYLTSIILFVILSASTFSFVASAQTVLHLSRVEFTGLNRYPQDQILANTGLQIGQVVDNAMLQAATERLADTGLFKTLTYFYRYVGDQAAVVFVTEEETDWNVPVVFDNFIWFDDKDVLDAVSRKVPGFAGLSANSEKIINRITGALDEFIQEKKIPGKVEYLPANDLSGQAPKFTFRVNTGRKMAVCNLHFAGTSEISESRLLKASDALNDSDYSRKFVTDFSQFNLIPIYREAGYLRAGIEPPVAKPLANGGPSDKDCVAVDIQVRPGKPYTWDRAEWLGNSAFASAELSSALNMKSGDRANGLKIDEGFQSVRRVLGEKGYIAGSIAPTPLFDDANLKVSYRVEVHEGAQFRMGKVEFTGLSDRDAKQLVDHWRLKAGAIYNASYLNDYLKNIVLTDSAVKDKRVVTSVNGHPETLIVDVYINVR